MDESERAAWVARATAGDEDALQRLIVSYHAVLRRVVAVSVDGELRHRVDPDDVLQQAYIAAFQSVTTCRFDGPGGFYKWLEAIALSRLEDQQRALRRQKRDATREADAARETTASYPDLFQRLASPESTPSRVVARDEAVAAVMSSLARLGQEQRAVIHLRFLEGRPVAEVAERLGKSEAAIHMLCHRGLKALRERMVSITRYLSQG